MEKTEKEMVSVRIPKAMNKRLDKYVDAIGVSKTAFILMLVSRELNCSIENALQNSGSGPEIA